MGLRQQSENGHPLGFEPMRHFTQQECTGMSSSLSDGFEHSVFIPQNRGRATKELEQAMTADRDHSATLLLGHEPDGRLLEAMVRRWGPNGSRTRDIFRT